MARPLVASERLPWWRWPPATRTSRAAGSVPSGVRHTTLMAAGTRRSADAMEEFTARYPW
ncbi:MAG TPA: hypothetical protein VHF25_00550 [Nitriliruptorales bacterium]|nr:hypothetical protein [Nitriliruptorales bacterium]